MIGRLLALAVALVTLGHPDPRPAENRCGSCNGFGGYTYLNRWTTCTSCNGSGTAS